MNTLKLVFDIFLQIQTNDKPMVVVLKKKGIGVSECFFLFREEILTI
jgi:hypothetical protein